MAKWPNWATWSHWCSNLIVLFIFPHLKEIGGKAGSSHFSMKLSNIFKPLYKFEEKPAPNSKKEGDYQMTTKKPLAFPYTWKAKTGKIPNWNKLSFLFVSVDILDKGNGEFACLVCGRKFNFKTSAVRHFRTQHTANHRTQCHICHKFFKNRISRNNHRAQEHGITEAMLRSGAFTPAPSYGVPTIVQPRASPLIKRPDPFN